MTEPTFSPINTIPDVALTSDSPVSVAFRDRACTTFLAAARYLRSLPYGRNTRPEDPLCVLTEGLGTCSTKHALLARLAKEEGIAGVELRLGLYEMTEANTPGVGPALARHGLASILEAHCYLAVHGRRVDVTREVADGAEDIGGFVEEKTIRPGQIGSEKASFHKQALAARVAEGSYGARTPEEVWAIREECIAALAAREGTASR